MDVNRLRVIDAVARTGSITAAAEELHYAQASVSHHLARLQEQVGATLTRRVGRGIVLTPEGELLAGRARDILRRIGDAESEVGALSRQLHGRLRIAAFQSALLSLVPPALASVRATHSDIELELRESHPEDSLVLVRANEIDVAIVHRPDDLPPAEDLLAVKLYEDPIYLLSTTPDDTVEAHRDSSWIAGCDRCRQGIESLCLAAGFRATDRPAHRGHLRAGVIRGRGPRRHHDAGHRAPLARHGHPACQRSPRRKATRVGRGVPRVRLGHRPRVHRGPQDRVDVAPVRSAAETSPSKNEP